MMSIEEFERKLRSSGVAGPGAKWVRVDFHVHAPSSHDYEYGEGDPYQKLGEALDHHGIQMAVILNHEGFPKAEELRRIGEPCPRTTLIPGAELNIFVDALSGGEKKVGQEVFYHCIVAVDPEQDGGNYGDFLLKQARSDLIFEKRGEVEGLAAEIARIGQWFRNKGALVIPAHLHQGKGFERSRSIDDIYTDEAFLRLLRKEAFDALEVRDLRTAEFFSGTHRTSAGLEIPEMRCVASSDAHHHKHIGERKRGTWIRLEKQSFAELQAALQFRHRVSLKAPDSGHPRVLGMHVVGSFVPDIWLQLNEGLNALIGSKGSGKTALLECLRFALNAYIPDGKRSDVSNHISHVLGSAGYVECLVQDAEGRKYLCVRRADSRDRIDVLEQNGQQYATADIPFRTAILGWHEIESVASDPSARLQLVDNLCGAAELNRLNTQLAIGVEQAVDFLARFQADARRLPSILRRLRDLERKRSLLNQLQDDDLIALKAKYEWYTKTLALLRDGAERATLHGRGLSEKIGLPSISVSAALDDVQDASAVGSLEDLVQRIETQETLQHQAESELQRQWVELGLRLETVRSDLDQRFATFRRDDYQPRLDALSAEAREILASHILFLEETSGLHSLKTDCERLLESVKKQAAILCAALDDIVSCQEVLASLRKNVVEDLNREVPSIQLSLLRASNVRERDEFGGRYGPSASLLLSRVQQFIGNSTHAKMRDLFGRVDSWSIDSMDLDTEAVLDSVLMDYLRVIIRDDVGIALRVGDKYVSVENLSAGQRCVAVFPLLLRNHTGPLFIDQPEDNLDNRYIANSIAPDLVQTKSGQQMLITCHNANLVVIADADLIVHVDSDGSRCEIARFGFLACKASVIRDSVLDVLDGGAGALDARKKKYGV